MAREAPRSAAVRAGSASGPGAERPVTVRQPQLNGCTTAGPGHQVTAKTAEGDQLATGGGGFPQVASRQMVQGIKAPESAGRSWWPSRLGRSPSFSGTLRG